MERVGYTTPIWFEMYSMRKAHCFRVAMRNVYKSIFSRLRQPMSFNFVYSFC